MENIAQEKPWEATQRAVEERNDLCYELHLSGLSFRKIAKQVGLPHVAVFEIVQHRLRDYGTTTRLSKDAARRLEVDRIDRVWEVMDERARAGDKDCASVATKLSERRAKLLGLDSPTQTELSGPDGGPIEITETEVLLKIEALTKALGGGDAPDPASTP